ncbi:hypothetical protein ACYX8G_19585 [Microbacterium saperdae]
MSAFGFDALTAEELIQPVYDQDAEGVATWCETHIRTHRDMHAFMEFLARMIVKTFPMALTKDVTLGPNDFWGLAPGPAATPSDIDAARMITAALNEDWATVTALIHATMSRPDVAHAEVVVHLLKAWGEALRAVGAANGARP